MLLPQAPHFESRGRGKEGLESPAIGCKSLSPLIASPAQHRVVAWDHQLVDARCVQHSAGTSGSRQGRGQELALPALLCCLGGRAPPVFSNIGGGAGLGRLALAELAPWLSLLQGHWAVQLPLPWASLPGMLESGQAAPPSGYCSKQGHIC